jgi:hypothetical protein
MMQLKVVGGNTTYFISIVKKQTFWLDSLVVAILLVVIVV